MPASIHAHGQSTLPDGRVIVSGGSASDRGANPFDIIYAYFPNSNTWEIVATISANFAYHGQSTLNDGRILISGGGATAFNSGLLNSTYIYDIDSNMWISGSSMSKNFSTHGQSTLNDGRVFVSGGLSENINNSAFLYILNNNVWTSGSPMPTSFRSPGQSAFNDGRVLVSGGYDSNGNRLNISYIYNPNDNMWIDTATLTIGSHAHKQSTLFDGRVLISGGYGSGSVRFNTSYIYTPNDTVGTWISAATLATVRYNHGQSTLADGRVLISGGSSTSDSNVFNTAYIYTPEGWSNRKGGQTFDNL